MCATSGTPIGTSVREGLPAAPPRVDRDAADLEGLRRVGASSRRRWRSRAGASSPGVTTAELDAWPRACSPATAPARRRTLVYGFPGAICISVDDEAVHGIPGPRRLRARRRSSSSTSRPSSTATSPTRRSRAVAALRGARGAWPRTRRAALAPAARRGARRRAGERHRRAPSRPRSAARVRRPAASSPATASAARSTSRRPCRTTTSRACASALTRGLVITIEPIIGAGAARLLQDDDGWTIRTRDGTLTAHAEHTVVVTRWRIAAGAHVRELRSQHPGTRGVLVDRVNEQLTRREALVAALAATTLGGGALLAPALRAPQRPRPTSA